MENSNEHNKNTEGYKVPGDGNAPNLSPPPGNRSFEENPDKVTHKSESDIPGKEFNIGDKAYFDSSKKDFVKTVSNHHHANEGEDLHRVDMHYKKPDGDR